MGGIEAEYLGTCTWKEGLATTTAREVWLTHPRGIPYGLQEIRPGRSVLITAEGRGTPSLSDAAVTISGEVGQRGTEKRRVLAVLYSNLTQHFSTTHASLRERVSLCPKKLGVAKPNVHVTVRPRAVTQVAMSRC